MSEQFSVGMLVGFVVVLLIACYIGAKLEGMINE